MRIHNLIPAEGHPRLRAKRILPAITSVTGSFSLWEAADSETIKAVFRKHVDRNQKHPRWLDKFYSDLYTNHRDVWNKFYYFAQTPELLVVPKLHIRAAIYDLKCPVCKIQWAPETQGWGCYSCTIKYPKIRWKVREAKSKATVKAKGQTSHWTPEAFRKAKATSRRLYGVDNPMQNSDVKAKAKATSLKVYGTSHPMQNSEVSSKMSESWRNKPSDIKALVVAKRKATNLKVYGTSNPMQNSRVQAKAKATWSTKDRVSLIVKAFDTHEARTGYRFPSQDPAMRAKRKLTYLARYGVDNPTKNPNILRKALRKAYNLYSVVVEGSNFKVQGSYELEALPKLVSMFGASNVLTQFSKGYPDTLSWTPDFYIKPKDLFVEIKSPWTLLLSLASNKNKARRSPNVKWLVLYKKVWLALPKKWYMHPDTEALLAGLFLRKTLKAKVNFSKYSVEINGKMFLNSELVGNLVGVRNLLSQRTKVVGARQCDLCTIESSVAKKFLDTYHVQGSVAAKHKLGLFYNKVLVAVATFRTPIITKGYTWELARLCIKEGYHIPGGASKLLSNFSKRHPGSIISYADARYSEGKVYKALGFKLLRKTNPGYKWIRGDVTYSRQKTMKHKLHKLLPVFDPNKSEAQNMVLNNFTKVKDKGQFVFIKE